MLTPLPDARSATRRRTQAITSSRLRRGVARGCDSPRRGHHFPFGDVVSRHRTFMTLLTELPSVTCFSCDTSVASRPSIQIPRFQLCTSFVPRASDPFVFNECLLHPTIPYGMLFLLHAFPIFCGPLGISGRRVGPAPRRVVLATVGATGSSRPCAS